MQIIFTRGKKQIVIAATIGYLRIILRVGCSVPNLPGVGNRLLIIDSYLCVGNAKLTADFAIWNYQHFI